MNLTPLLNAFPKKIRVTFIHSVTGQLIGTQKMKPDQLPFSFNKPTNIQFEGIEWRIMYAKPVHATEFISDYKLTLHVQEVASIDPAKVGVDIATICDCLPEFTEDLFSDDLYLQLSKTGWRQLEFLPIALLPEIQEEMLQVESVLFPGEGINTLMGYKHTHIRKKIENDSLKIPWEEFCKSLGLEKRGSVRFSKHELIQNSFSAFSGNYTYYGIAGDNMIEKLCLENFDSADEEFCRVTSLYDLVLADWCNGKIIMG